MKTQTIITARATRELTHDQAWSELTALAEKLEAKNEAMLTALADAEFILRKLAVHPDDCRTMRDTLLRSAADARAALAI